MVVPARRAEALGYRYEGRLRGLNLRKTSSNLPGSLLRCFGSRCPASQKVRYH
jgi:hypothetical protein